MLVTRTEVYTDWSYQGVHMGEQAATVGVGLMTGHIYFRYAYDFLQDGDKIQRERSFIELSDGTTYELGTGASASKITVIDHGLTSGGEVYIEVIGKPEVGVGVSRILRHVTIEYDDGKVPVLDTEQLEEVMTELSDHLTQSMVNTAEAVKQELRNELNTSVADVQIQMQNVLSEKLNATKTELRQETASAIQVVTNDLDDWVDSAGETHDDINERIDRVSDNVLDLTNRVHVGMWHLAYAYVVNTSTINVLNDAPKLSIPSKAFEYDASSKTIKFFPVGGAEKHHVIRLTLTSNVTVDNGIGGHIYFQLKDSTGNTVLSQATIGMLRSYGADIKTHAMQLTASLFIPKGELNHVAFVNGLRLTLWNRTGGPMSIEGDNKSSLTVEVIAAAG